MSEAANVMVGEWWIVMPRPQRFRVYPRFLLWSGRAGRPLRRYNRRWTVERTSAWLQNYRRLRIRWEKFQLAFQGFLYLACSLSLMKEVLG